MILKQNLGEIYIYMSLLSKLSNNTMNHNSQKCKIHKEIKIPEMVKILVFKEDILC